jgi:hypothetical protein
MFILIQKKLKNQLRVERNKVYVRDFAELSENFVEDFICSVAVNNQIQYFVEKEPEKSRVISENKMKKISKDLNSLEHQSVLQGIKAQFGVIKQNQDRLSISKLVLDDKQNKETSLPFKVSTQEFLKEKENEIKDKLSTVKNKEDLADLMNMLLEIFNMRSEDLKESTGNIIDKILSEETDRSKKLSEESRHALKEIEDTILQNDKKEIDYLVNQRGIYLERLKEVENQVNQRISAVKRVSIGYLSDLKDSSCEVLKGKYRNLLPVENKLAFQEVYKNNGLIIKSKTEELVKVSGKIIDDLQEVVSKYNSLMNLDTNIIQSQKKLVETLSTQNVTERVQYLDPLTAKINLLVSPIPNLGASTLLKIFSNKWNRLLVLDFREVISNPDIFEIIDYNKFLSSDLDLFNNNKIKVNSQMAEGVNEEELKERLKVVEGSFDAIIVIVDKYMTLGMSVDDIQRIIYLSDTAEKNLLEINKIIQTYEPLLENLNKKMLVLNKMTISKKQDTKYLLITAGVDPSKVRINNIDLSPELIDDDDSVLRLMNSRFNYF